MNGYAEGPSGKSVDERRVDANYLTLRIEDGPTACPVRSGCVIDQLVSYYVA